MWSVLWRGGHIVFLLQRMAGCVLHSECDLMVVSYCSAVSVACDIALVGVCQSCRANL